MCNRTSKQLAGFILFWIGIGMIVMLFMPNDFVGILISADSVAGIHVVSDVRYFSQQGYFLSNKKVCYHTLSQTKSSTAHLFCPREHACEAIISSRASAYCLHEVLLFDRKFNVISYQIKIAGRYLPAISMFFLCSFNFVGSQTRSTNV